MTEPVFTTQELQSEEWREIPGYEGSFISNLGRVRGKFGRVRRLATLKGYKRITLQTDGKLRTFPVHRLVALAFISSMPPDKTCINHIDGCKTNNRAINLEWCSHKENSEHATNVLKVVAHGSQHCKARITPEIVLQIHQMRMEGISSHKIAAQIDISRSTVEHVLDRQTWTRYTVGLPTNYPVIPHEHHGTANPNAKLSEDDVRNIRKLLAEGVSGPKIARQFGVNHGAVYEIKNGKKWTHVV